MQKLNLLPIDDHLKAMEWAGFNTFLLQNCDVFMDMLTDSGTNVMPDQQAASISRRWYWHQSKELVSENAGSDSFPRRVFN